MESKALALEMESKALALGKQVKAEALNSNIYLLSVTLEQRWVSTFTNKFWFK
jgi:hypothetical protein